MVIWPKEVSQHDEGWQEACALMQVLPLDPRMAPAPTRHLAGRSFFDSADDYLVRPFIYLDRQRVAAPYYQYSLRFAVSASVHGSIPVDHTAELEEFRRAVNEALRGPLTSAERERWSADAQRVALARCDPQSEIVQIAQAEASRNALRYYDAARTSIAEARSKEGYVGASLTSHEEVLQQLIVVGNSLRQHATLRR